MKKLGYFFFAVLRNWLTVCSSESVMSWFTTWKSYSGGERADIVRTMEDGFRKYFEKKSMDQFDDRSFYFRTLKDSRYWINDSIRCARTKRLLINCGRFIELIKIIVLIDKLTKLCSKAKTIFQSSNDFCVNTCFSVEWDIYLILQKFFNTIKSSLKYIIRIYNFSYCI